jgi:hypothetical protein
VSDSSSPIMLIKSGMREHPFTASPIDNSPNNPSLDPDADFALRPYDIKETFPSALAPGGRVGWSRFSADKEGYLKVSYPGIKYVHVRFL